MELEFLGIGSAYNPAYGNTSACFILGGTFFLLDCGETVFRELILRNRLEKVKKAVILITHFHADHCGSLPTLISYLYSCVGAQVAVYHPDSERLISFLNACGAGHETYKMALLDDEEFTAGARITPIRVQHSMNMPSYGYLVECDEGSFFYSGDAAGIPERVLSRFLSGEIDRLYIDCCPGPSHDHGELARHCASIPEDKRDHVFCMHLSGDYADQIRDKGFGIAGQEDAR